MKAKEPTVFDGCAVHARSFLLECKLYIQGNVHQFPNDQQKILFILTYCQEGSAANLRDHIVARAETRLSGTTETTGYGSYDNFEKEFKEAFITTDDKGEALRELINLKQRGSVDAYIQRFKMLITRAGITDFKTTKSYLISGLSDYITDKLRWQAELPDHTKGIDAWYKLIQGFDTTNRLISAVKGGRASGTYVAQARELPQGKPIDIDAMRLSKNDRDQHMHEGRCFECNERGHVARDCPQKKKTTTAGYRGPMRNGSGRSAVSQIRSLLKDLSADKRKQVMEEMRGNPVNRIWAILQEVPDDEKEEAVEQVVEEDFQ